MALELGGKSPFIVFPDADLDAAAATSMGAVWGASGQVCTCGTRVLVHESIYDDWVNRIVDGSKNIKIGPGMDPTSEMGPVVSAAQLERVKKYVAIGQEEGAELVLGGHQVGDKGYFHEPTVFTGVRNDMRIAQEEIFGPVMGILPFSTEEDAYRIANDVSYGLAAGVWTNDLDRSQRAARALKAGTVWINTYQMVYPSVPVRRREDVRPRPHARRDVGRGDDHGQERLDGGPLMSASDRTAAAGPPRRRRRDLPVRVDASTRGTRRGCGPCSPTTCGRSTATPSRSPAATPSPSGSPSATEDMVWQHHLLSVYHTEIDGDTAKALTYHTSYQLAEGRPRRPCSCWSAAITSSSAAVPTAGSSPASCSRSSGESAARTPPATSPRWAATDPTRFREPRAKRRRAARPSRSTASGRS